MAQDIFDQLSKQGGTPPPPSPSPSSSTPNTTTQPPLSTQPTQQPVQGKGDIFDQLSSGAADQSLAGASTPTATAPHTDWNSYGPIHIDPNDSVFVKAVKGLNSVGAGIGSGILDTLSGGSDLINHAGRFALEGEPVAVIPQSVTDFLHQKQTELGQQNIENQTLNSTGRGTESLMEFLTGEEVLKGLAMSERLMKASKVAKLLEGASPRVLKALSIGADALRNGFTQGAITTVKTGGDVGKGAEQGAIVAGLTGGLGTLSATVKAIANSATVESIQGPLKEGIQNIIKDAADKLGVNTPAGQSIRDTAQQVSDSVRTRATSLYKTIDNISGGQAQRFRDAEANVAQKLREVVGLDDDKEAELTAQQLKIQMAHAEMLDKLEAAGHPRDMLDQANAQWRQQSALTDLNNAIQRSTKGVPPQIAAGAAATPETVNAAALRERLIRLNTPIPGSNFPGRLEQAIGKENAESLIMHVDAAARQAKDIATRNAWVGKVARFAGNAAVGGVGGAIAGSAVSHFF